MVRIVLFICICQLVFSLRAQPDHLIFDNYTLENGLSNNHIQSAFQDSRGYIWFATNHGVCRYDGYKFVSFRNDPGNPECLSGLLARVIYEDKNKNLWVGTESGGLNLFNRNREIFDHILQAESDTTIGTSVKAIVEDKYHRLWMGTNIGIKLYDPYHNIVKSFPYIPNSPYSPSDTYVRVLQFDNAGRLWVGTNAGLDVMDTLTGRFIPLHIREPDLMDEIWEIYKDKQGKLWIGTYHNGLFKVDPATLEVSRIDLNYHREWSRTVRAVVQDSSGLYWIGTRDGLYIYNAKEDRRTWFGNVEGERKSLVNNSILDIFIDAAQDIWICTRGGISQMVPERQIFKHYKPLNNSNKYLNNGEVYAVWEDTATGKIWIGTDKGGVNILDRKSDEFAYLTNQEGNLNSISGNCIKAFMDDGQGNVWIGTYEGGISLYNKASKRFAFFKHDSTDEHSLSDNKVWALHCDKKGNIWVGTDSGLDLYNPSEKNFFHHNPFEKDQGISWINEDASGDLWLGLSSRLAIYNPQTGEVNFYKEQGTWFHQDMDGRCWVASMNNGLVLYDKHEGPIKYYDERDGLPNNQVLRILEDNNGKLWLSTANGLSMFDPETEEFINYNKKDGLQDNQFHYGAAYKLSTGELVFGGINGFNLFDPDKVIENNYIPPVVLSDLRIFNKSVKIGDEFSVLDKSISEADELVIPYKYDVITFEFAALNFANSDRNRYRFKLVGFDQDWTKADFSRTATYTNLDPGDYMFSVEASNNDKLWNPKRLEMNVSILPPFWKTWWFNTILIITILTIVYLIASFLINRERLKQQLKLERLKARQVHETDLMKLRFFTNISHEIRTPLTLIAGPLERMRSTSMSMDQIKNQIDLMHRNVGVLLKLINQLLDFRKLQTGNLKLELKNGDLIIFLNEIVNSFAPLASEKEIKLRFNTVHQNLFAYFDADKIEKILNNLLTNAFKFTTNGGSVSLNVTVGIDASIDSHDRYVDIVVKDNGIGIAEQNRDRIFQRFFQSSESKHNTGTGIGLAFTKELVKLHRGEIFIESKLGRGSRFTVRLPLIESEIPEVGPRKEISVQAEKLMESRTRDKTDNELISSKILLIVEDHGDVRRFVRLSFEGDFHVIEAEDGKKGLQLAQKLLPDIILSDVMMPGIDGNEFCKKIKADERTSHIPVILLTALSSREHAIKGLSSGADDYITKPFDMSILQTKIENLLSLRKSMQERFSNQVVLAPSNVALSSPDEKFLQKAIEVIENNIDNSELDIETFSAEMGVSRMQMYRKLSALTDMTVKEFIRDIRLKRAIQLLDQNKMTISEIGYAVGFQELSHFRKCFREKYGMSASEYLKQHSPVNHIVIQNNTYPRQ